MISIVTINFNNAAGLEKTIKSVIKQTFTDFEYIVIDGGSTDNSVEVIKNYNENISVWLSEIDDGLFDAMNKGVSISTKEYVIFMNSGDYFYSNNVLENIQPHLTGNDLIYGDNIINYPWLNYKRLRKAGETKNLWKGLQFSHQSLFSKRKLLLEHPFNYKDYNGADTEFVLFCYYKRNCSFKKVDYCISEIEAGGISDQNRSIKDRLSIIKKYDPKFPSHKYYYYTLYFYYKLIKKSKLLLPKRLLRFFYSVKYSIMH